MKKEGKEIIDIGPDFNRRLIDLEKGIPYHRKNYNMERQRTKGYEGYKKGFERKGKFEGTSEADKYRVTE